MMGFWWCSTCECSHIAGEACPKSSLLADIEDCESEGLTAERRMVALEDRVKTLEDLILKITSEVHEAVGEEPRRNIPV